MGRVVRLWTDTGLIIGAELASSGRSDTGRSPRPPRRLPIVENQSGRNFYKLFQPIELRPLSA